MRGEKEEGKTNRVWPNRIFLENLPTANLDPSCLSVSLSLSQSLSVFQSISGVIVGNTFSSTPRNVTLPRTSAPTHLVTLCVKKYSTCFTGMGEE